MTINVGVDFTAENAWPDLMDRNIIHIAHGAPLRFGGIPPQAEGESMDIVIRLDVPEAIGQTTILARMPLSQLVSAVMALESEYAGRVYNINHNHNQPPPGPTLVPDPEATDGTDDS